MRKLAVKIIAGNLNVKAGGGRGGLGISVNNYHNPHTASLFS